jgi:hypothetical protein
MTSCKFLFTFTVFAIAACDTDPDPADWPDELAYGVRDSAGVTIVESRRPATESRLGWRVGDRPILTIGTEEAEDGPRLYQVQAATRLPNGNVVVANGGSSELLVFDETGAFVAAWAGQGEGPGEFTDLSGLGRLAGDSLIATDALQGRVSVFDSQGNHGRTTKLEGEPGPLMRALAMGPVPYVMIGVLPNGTLLTKSTDGYETRGFWRWTNTYALVKADGTGPISLGEYPGPETYSDSYTNEAERMVYVSRLRHPFGKTTAHTVWGDLVAFGRNETYEIRAFAADGSLARIVRREHASGSPTQEQLDAHFRERFASMPDEQRTSRLEVAANVPMVETFPAYSNMRSDALGHLWVAEFKLPDEDHDFTLWTVFDQEGLAAGFVETPPGLVVYEIGADYILGKRTGDLDIESVEVWELSRQGPSS